MNYFNDVSFIGGVFGTLAVALIILLQVIKGLSLAVTEKMKMKKTLNLK